MMFIKSFLVLAALLLVAQYSIQPVSCGLATCAAGIAYHGTCQTACNFGYGTCMAASGLVAGAAGPVGWWAWITSAAAACSLAQGACMVVCATTAAGLCAAPLP